MKLFFFLAAHPSLSLTHTRIHTNTHTHLHTTRLPFINLLLRTLSLSLFCVYKCILFYLSLSYTHRHVHMHTHVTFLEFISLNLFFLSFFLTHMHKHTHITFIISHIILPRIYALFSQKHAYDPMPMCVKNHFLKLFVQKLHLAPPPLNKGYNPKTQAKYMLVASTFYASTLQ